MAWLLKDFSVACFDLLPSSKGKILPSSPLITPASQISSIQGQCKHQALCVNFNLGLLMIFSLSVGGSRKLF